MKNPSKVLPQLMVAVVGSLAYFCTGTSRGWGSPGIPSLNRTLQEEENGTMAGFTENDFKWISAIPMMGSFVGALLVSIPLHYCGRKFVLLGQYVIFSIGFLFIGYTNYHRNKYFMYVGRALGGFAIGCAIPASQIYVSECSSPRIRGRLGSFTASSLALGIWSAYIIGAFVEWHVHAWIFSALPVVFFVLTLFMPETPIWLLTHGKEDQARQSLQKLRGPNTDITDEFNRIKDNIENSKAHSGAKNTVKSSEESETTTSDQHQQQQQKSSDGFNWSTLLEGRVLKPLGISMGIMFFQQATGVNAIIFHTVSIFQMAGSKLDGRYCTIIVGFVQVAITIASGFFVDYFGRRVLLLGSSALTSASLAAMGTFFYFQRLWGEERAAVDLGWLPLLSLIVFFVAYSAGLSNVPFIVMGELFPSQFRSTLGTISSSINLIVTFMVVRFFPDMLLWLGKDVTFFLFTVCTLASIGFVYFLLPETKGKTMEEMEKLFTGSKAVIKQLEETKEPATHSNVILVSVIKE